MSWGKIDDSIPHHPKFVKAGPVASWFWVCGNCYCNHYLTDGFIAREVLPTIGHVPNPARQAETLVRAGLWEAVDGGYQVHDFHDHNPSADEIRRKREADRVRKESERSPRGIRTESARNPLASRARVPNPTPSPIPEEKKEPSSATADALRTRFNEFWAAYPRKVGKDAAWRAFQKRRPNLDTLAQMVAALDWQTASEAWTKDGGRYIPHPSTWLHQGRWQDEPLAMTPAKRSMCPHSPACETITACTARTVDEGRMARGECLVTRAS